MIVIARKVGRLANRLLLFSHFIAAAREHGLTITNLAFARFSTNFPTTARDPLCRYPPGRPRSALLANPYTQELLLRASIPVIGALHRRQLRGADVGLIRLRRDQHLDLDSEPFLSVARRHRTVFVQDWNFRTRDGCRRHGDAIRAFFTPHAAILEEARRCVEPARDRQRLVVGVHLRQTDYATFKDGRYFYDHDDYREAMRRCQRAHADRELAFLVCSDAPLPDGFGDGFDLLRGPGSAIGDLYALAACDRILGPPSTYSRWASYWGRVPRLVLEAVDQPIAGDGFVTDETLGYGSVPRRSP